MSNIIYKETHSLKSIPVSLFKYDSFLSEDDKNVIRNYKNYNPRYPNGAYISSTYSLFTDYNLSSLEKKFNKCIETYVKEVLEVSLEFKLTGSWCTKNEKGTHHHWHNHPNNLLSAVAYFDDEAGEELLSGISFKINGLNEIFKSLQLSYYNYNNNPVNNYNKFNAETWDIRPDSNSVIIMPAHLEHRSLPNHTSARYCVGANYFIKGLFGSVSQKDTLQL